MSNTSHDAPSSSARRRPEIGVGLFVLDDSDRFLLLERAGSHGAGCWGLVGGHVEFGQSPQDAAADEAAQEVGLTLDPAEIVLGPYTNDVFPDEGKHYYTLFVSIRLPQGQVPRNLEPHKCARMDWFSFDRLPERLFIPVRNFLRQPVRPPFRAFA